MAVRRFARRSGRGRCCPNVNRVTASDGHGGTETLTLDHRATGLHIAIALGPNPSGKGPPYWQGSSSGGNVTADDVFDDVSSNAASR
jgi:hypothetical protein